MSLRGEKAKAKAKAKLDDAKLAADQEWEALKHASSTPAHKVSGMTPEERETGAAGAVSVLSLASAVGDRKTALVGGVAANVLASSPARRLLGSTARHLGCRRLLFLRRLLLVA